MNSILVFDERTLFDSSFLLASAYTGNRIGSVTLFEPGSVYTWEACRMSVFCGLIKCTVVLDLARNKHLQEGCTVRILRTLHEEEKLGLYHCDLLF